MEHAPTPIQPLHVKTYRHFPAEAFRDKPPVEKRLKEFFYIGVDAIKIDQLVTIFGSGYAAESVERAVSVLQRIIGNTPIPDIFIVDASVGEQAIRTLTAFTKSYERLAQAPVVLDITGLGDEEILTWRQLRVTDELVALGGTDNNRLNTLFNLLLTMTKLAAPDLHAKQASPWYQIGVKLRSILKRCVDLTIASMLLVCLSPLFLIIAVAIRYESSGPVFYVAKRAGKGYRMFRFFKFRTMVQHADKHIEQLSHLNRYSATNGLGTVFFKAKNDKRITRVGAFLRNYSLDELPQLLNVLLGDMSIVGNRPLPLYEAAKLTTDQWATRFLAPAGITGLWQIKKRRRARITMEERINLDITYAEKYNFMYDLWIIANTPSALIQRSNA